LAGKGREVHHRLCLRVGGGVIGTEHGKPVFNAVEVGNRAIHIEAESSHSVFPSFHLVCLIIAWESGKVNSFSKEKGGKAATLLSVEQINKKGRYQPSIKTFSSSRYF
jgi:hypothetical protein